jgi:hypothetical protein
MNIKQKARHDKLVKGFVQELEINGYAVILYGVITKVIEAKTIDEKLTALEYLLKTITDNKTGDV